MTTSVRGVRWGAGLLAASVAIGPGGSLAQGAGAAPAAVRPPGQWTPSVGLSFREAYDSNVYLQDVGALADKDSMVTTVTPAVGVKFQSGPDFGVSLSYAPEVTFFHDESSEDHVLHRVGLGLSGVVQEVDWDWQTSLIGIDGADEGLVFGGPGGAPAAGGPALRDRRDAVVFRSGLKFTRTWGNWFVRPMASAYIHDFRSEHIDVPGYLNYDDRNEYIGGFDAGIAGTSGATGAEALRLGLGYRYGRQDQAPLMDYPEEYDNAYHRALAILEGSPWTWLKIAVAVGPEFRRYGDQVPATFGNRDVVNLFADVSATLTPSPVDTVTVAVRQFEQPAFGGRAAYEDLTYDLSWRRRLGKRFTVGAGGRAYNTDFLQPVVRNDWVWSANAVVGYTPVKSLQAEISYLFEDGESRVDNTAGREYSRHVVALGLRYTWK